jgi:hypothetical protein
LQGRGTHLLRSCHSPQLLTPRKSNNDEAHNRAKAGVRRSSCRGQPLEMLVRQCPRVVEAREPATETTLEDVLARNLSIRGVMHPRGVCHPVLPVLPVHCSTCQTLFLLERIVIDIAQTCLKALLASSPRPRPHLPCCPDCRPPSRRHACAAPVRPSALSSAPRQRGPAPRRTARAVRPTQGEAAAHRAQYLVGRASGRAGVGR